MKMKIILPTVLISLSLSISAFACRTDRVVIANTTSFGFSFGGGDSSFTGEMVRRVEVPLSVDNKQGCMTQISSLDFEAQTSKGGTFAGKFNIHLPKTTFKKVKGHTETYILFNEESSSDRDKLSRLQISPATATCVGNTVVSLESFEGDLSNAKDLHDYNQSLNISYLIMTGSAAAKLRSCIFGPN